MITFPFASTEPSEPYTFMPEPYLKYSADQMKFNGYATRYLSPRETASWRVSKFRGIFFSSVIMSYEYLNSQQKTNLKKNIFVLFVCTVFPQTGTLY